MQILNMGGVTYVIPSGDNPIKDLLIKNRGDRIRLSNVSKNPLSMKNIDRGFLLYRTHIN
jgi:hypothetical protein